MSAAEAPSALLLDAAAEAPDGAGVPNR